MYAYERFYWNIGIVRPVFFFAVFSYACLCAIFFSTTFGYLASHRSTDDGGLINLMLWSAGAKPIVAFSVVVCYVFMLFYDVVVFFIVVVCGAVLAGSIAVDMRLLFDYLATCNKPGNANNFCNDPLYCCAMYDSTVACANIGPCIKNETENTYYEPSDLDINPDFKWAGFIFILFTVLEVVLIVSTFWVLIKLKRQRETVHISRKMLYLYRSGESIDTPRVRDDEETNNQEEDDNEYENESKKRIQTTIGNNIIVGVKKRPSIVGDRIETTIGKNSAKIPPKRRYGVLKSASNKNPISNESRANGVLNEFETDENTMNENKTGWKNRVWGTMNHLWDVGGAFKDTLTFYVNSFTHHELYRTDPSFKKRLYRERRLLSLERSKRNREIKKL